MGQTSSISHRERLHVGQLLAAYERNDHNKTYPVILAFVQWFCITSKKPTIAFHMPLDFRISGLPRFDTFLAHLSNSDNRDKFCVAVVQWTPLFEGHVSLLLAGMFTHRPGATVRWRMYDPNYPFDYTCHDAAYTQAYAALLQKVQHGLQQAVAASPYKAHVAQIACNLRGAGLIATQGDLQRSCLRMSDTKGMCMLICLSVLTQLVDNAIICNVSDDKYVRAFGHFSFIDNCISIGLARHSEEPAKVLSELAEILASDLRQVYHNFGGCDCLSLLRPASLRALGLPLLLLLPPSRVLRVLRVVVLRGQSRSHGRLLIVRGVSA